MRQFRKLGVEGALARVPEGVRYYLTIDIDGFDPSIAPGHRDALAMAGFSITRYWNSSLGWRSAAEIVGVDLVEVAPDYDHTGTTSILAAQVLLNTIGRIMAAR